MVQACNNRCRENIAMCERIYSDVALHSVGAKSALLRRFFQSVIRPLPCSSFFPCDPLCWARMGALVLFSFSP